MHRQLYDFDQSWGWQTNSEHGPSDAIGVKLKVPPISPDGVYRGISLPGLTGVPSQSPSATTTVA